MLVSVIIGALNEERYIATTLEGVRQQKTKHKIELIVGDGYSEDKTASIAKSYGARVVKEERRSAAWERQAACKVANGEVLAITDADAKLPQDWVQNIAAEFAADKSLVMVYGPVYFFDASGWENKLSKVVMDIFISVSALFGMHNPIGSNMAVRTKAFSKIRGFNTKLVTAEDLDLLKRISKIGKVKYCSNVAVGVSSRRVKKWGYLRFAIFHMVNAFKFHLTGKAQKKYEPVR
ncbi:MAG TPA: glycosyltransferase [archaeon]|nr:glycosyltransferase [archaeon]